MSFIYIQNMYIYIYIYIYISYDIWRIYQRGLTSLGGGKRENEKRKKIRKLIEKEREKMRKGKKSENY